MTSPRVNRRRAVVIGGSMSGLIAGLRLRQRGWDVDIFERVDSELAGRGAGIVAQPELIETLRELGLEHHDLGVEVVTRKVLDAEGRLVGEQQCRQIMTAWERVYRILRDGLPAERYHRGVGLLDFVQDRDGVTARLSDGRSIRADLLVGADGLRSTVRQQCMPDFGPLYAGYVAWRLLLPEGVLPPQVHRELFAYMAFCLPPGEQFLGYPVAGPDNDLRHGHRRYNVVWYRPADEATELKRLLTDADGVTHAISIPPPLIRPEVIAEMRAAAERLLSPSFRQVVRLAAQPLLQPIYDLETPRMAFGRVAILGDAAFVARPHVGAGVAKAADDAAALAQALDVNEDVDTALEQFEAVRLLPNRRIIAQARHLGAYLQASRVSAEEEANSARYSVPQAIMAETALTDFLYR